MAIVYQHRRKDSNDIFYIGMGKTKDRAYSKKGRNKYWKAVYDKHGIDVDILIEGCSLEYAKKIEIGLIHDLGRKDLGLGYLCNMTDGGEGSINPSPEVVESIRNKLKGSKRTKESIQKQKISRIGYKISDETKAKISKAHMGKFVSIETRKKQSQVNKIPKLYSRKSISQYDKLGNFINKYDSLLEASRLTGVKNTSICNNLKQISQTSGGYIWKYN